MELLLKKLFNTFICIVLVFSYFSTLPGNLVKAQGSHFASGSGTGVDPYIIMTAVELDNVRQYTNQSNVYFKLGADIDLTGLNWVPIGEHGNAFSGVFDGNGFTIRNLTITNSNKEYVGLFGKTDHATIKNVKLENVDINNAGTTVMFPYLGALVGDNFGKIKNSYARGSVIGTRNTGGLVGSNGNWGEIHNSFFDGTVEGTWNIGGLTGGNSGTIRNSYSSGAYVKGENNVGGLIGESMGGAGSSTKNSYSFMERIERTAGDGGNFGRITGLISIGTHTPLLENNFAIESMIATGDSISITFIPNPNGNDGANISLTEAQSSVHFINNNWDFNYFWGMPETPGFPTPIQNTEENPYLITNETELNNIRNYLDGHYKLANDITLTTDWVPIEGSFTGTLNGNDYKIIGLNINRPLENNIGLFKETSNAKIRNIILEDVNVVGQTNVGALIGRHGGFSSGYIDNVSVTGNVSGDQFVGGLIGWVLNDTVGQISNVYFRGNVVGANSLTYVGGISGGGHLPVSNAFVLGTVTGSARVGGIVGGNSSSISNSYALNTSIIRNGGSTSYEFGRVAGYNSYGTTLTNNYGLTEVTEPFTNAFWQKTLTGKDGQDLTAMAAINMISGFPDSFKKNDMIASLSTIAAQNSHISILTVQTTDISADASNVQYTINFTSSMFGALQQNDVIEIQFANEFTIPSTITANDLQLMAEGTEITLSDSHIEVLGQTINISLPQAVSENTSFEIMIKSAAGVKNPLSEGNYNVSVKTTADAVPVESNVVIGSSNKYVRDLAIELSNSVSDAQGVAYHFTFNTSPTGNLISNTGVVEIEFPSEYVLPTNISENISLDIGGTIVAVPTNHVQVTNNLVAITVPSDVMGSTSVGVTIEGIDNPSMGMYGFTVSTSADPILQYVNATISLQQGMKLIDIAPGHIVSLAGLKWLVVTPGGETENSKLLLFDPYGEVIGEKAFKTSEPYNVFDPNNETSVAHYLNNDFYSSVLNNAERDWIVGKEWNTKGIDGNIVHGTGSINAKVGLLTADEFNYWKDSNFGTDFLQSGPNYWWLITPYSDSILVYEAWSDGRLDTYGGNQSNSYVRPAIYVHNNVVVTGGLGTEDAPFELAFNDIISVTEVSIGDGNQSISVGAELQLTALILPDNATNQTVNWTTSDEAVASVDSTGRLTGIGVGTATITVTTADGNYSDSITVTVTGDSSNQYTVTFNSNGGTEVQPINANHGSIINAPVQPVKSGYVFVGWFKDINLQQEWNFSSDTVPNSNVTLYAKWIPRTTQIIGNSQNSNQSMIIFRDNETGLIRVYFPNS